MHHKNICSAVITMLAMLPMTTQCMLLLLKSKPTRPQFQRHLIAKSNHILEATPLRQTAYYGDITEYHRLISSPGENGKLNSDEMELLQRIADHRFSQTKDPKYPEFKINMSSLFGYYRCEKK